MTQTEIKKAKLTPESVKQFIIDLLTTSDPEADLQTLLNLATNEKFSQTVLHKSSLPYYIRFYKKNQSPQTTHHLIKLIYLIYQADNSSFDEEVFEIVLIMFSKADSTSVKEYIQLLFLTYKKFLNRSNFKQPYLQSFKPYIGSSNLEVIEMGTTIALFIIQTGLAKDSSLVKSILPAVSANISVGQKKEVLIASVQLLFKAIEIDGIPSYLASIADCIKNLLNLIVEGDVSEILEPVFTVLRAIYQAISSASQAESKKIIEQSLIAFITLSNQAKNKKFSNTLIQFITSFGFLNRSEHLLNLIEARNPLITSTSSTPCTLR